MNCPRCETALEKTKIEEPSFSIAIDKCPTCAGIYFEKDVLQKVENIVEPVLLEIRSIPTEYHQLTALNCPSCTEHPRMEKAAHDRDENVVMDVCPQCHGIWLDAGELEAIQKENWWKSIYDLFRKLS